jgi:hypothetical protein
VASASPRPSRVWRRQARQGVCHGVGGRRTSTSRTEREKSRTGEASRAGGSARGNARLYSRAGRPHRCSAGRERGGKRGEGEEKGRRTWESGGGRPDSAPPPPFALPPVRLCFVLLSARPPLLCPLLRPSGCLLCPITLCSAVCSVPLLRHPMLICSGLCSARPALFSARLLHPSGPALLRSSGRPSGPFPSLFFLCVLLLCALLDV